jgi:hypothetical protein
MLKNLVASDIIEKLGERLEESRWYIDPESGKYTALGRAFLDPRKLWIYTNPKREDAVCTVYQMIVSTANFIPTPCLNCWKVVAKPFTLYELMQLWDFQKEFTKDCMYQDRFCKCGVEPRPWVHQNYGGYFYNNSKEQGLERWHEVRNAVDKINPEIPVVLKRYCTEYEIALGPSDKYVQTPWMIEAEKEIFSAIDLDSIGRNVTQPEYMVRHILRKWIEFAYDRGDSTALLFNDGEHLFSQPVTYHPKEDIK